MILKKREQDIIDDFNLFQDWSEKYEYIINLGKELSPLKKDLKCSANLIRGCQSNVWLVPKIKDGKIFFSADSDALITKGLVALLVKIFSGANLKDVALFDITVIKAVGLDKHLSMNRSNGLGKMIEQIKKISLNYLKE